MLIAGLNPFRLVDESYRGFLGLVAVKSRPQLRMRKLMKRSGAALKCSPNWIAQRRRFSLT